MDTTDIPKPWIYKNKWMIWSETILDNIKIADCKDTVNGICLSGKTVQQCIDECVGECAAGYHVQFRNGNTICVPIRTSIHPYLNPVYRLRNQTIYPELKEVKVSTFVNTNIFPFPPDYANVVFYRDVLTIKETVYNTTIGTETAKIENRGMIYLGLRVDNNIELLPTQQTATQVSQHIPLRYGEPFHISVPNTSLLAVMSITLAPALEWNSTSGMFYGNDTSFRIMPIDDSKRVGDIVSYDDKFAILYADDSVVVVDSNYNYLTTEYNSLENILNEKKAICTFQFISKMMGYYCDGSKCKSVPIKDIQTFGTSGRYNGMIVGRNIGCWGLCEDIMEPNTTYPFFSTTVSYTQNFYIIKWIFGMIFIILSIILIIFVIRKSR